MTYWRGKVVIVTGGSSGLGREIAETFAEAGAKVVIAARNAEKLNDTADELKRGGGEVLAVPSDITCQTQVDGLIERAISVYGRLDALVNNAGRSVRGRILETTPEKFQELLDLNFIALVRCTRAAMPHLLESRGHLINIGSLAAKSAGRYVGAYPATKFAVAAYTQQLRLELADEGLHVLLVCPGPIARDDMTPRYGDDLMGLPPSAHRPGAGVKVKSLDPRLLARDILIACERRQPELVRPAKARILFALSSLSPRLGDWLVRRMT
jgi:NAD(P)-dependent dehydrogenase (short-subunit alcohol dehydrogenase family)